MSNYGCIGSGAPVYYDYVNVANGFVTPSTVHVKNTSLSWFFKRYLFQKAISVFEWKLPDSWARDYFLYVLYSWGFISIINTNKFGVIPQGCGLRGYDVFYRPTNCIISNPLLRGNLEPRIGKDCILLKLKPDYTGLLDLVDYYGDIMALAAETLGTNLLNSKLAYVFLANNKASAEALKKLYDRIASGEPAVVQDKSLAQDDGKTPSWDTFSQNLGQNFISDKLMDLLNTIENRFDTDIGIPNANTDKRERLIVDEVNANNVATTTKAELWLESLQQGCREAHAMFDGLNPANFWVEWRVNPEEPASKTDEGGGEDA
mgnify:CR=1 FL=1